MARYINHSKGDHSRKNIIARIAAMALLDFIVVWSLLQDFPEKWLYVAGYVLLFLVFTAVGIYDVRRLVKSKR